MRLSHNDVSTFLSSSNPYFFAHVASLTASAIDADQIGGWNMAFLNKDSRESRSGVKGNIQYRTWNAGYDLDHVDQGRFDLSARRVGR